MERSFGQLLRETRRDKGVSQRDLADAIGVDFSYISKIENDRLPPPAGDTIVRICQVLGVPSELLLAQSGKVSSDIAETISSSEGALRFINEVKGMNLTDDEWLKLTQKLKSLR